MCQTNDADVGDNTKERETGELAKTKLKGLKMMEKSTIGERYSAKGRG